MLRLTAAPPPRHRDTDTAAGTALLRIIIIAVLLALQSKITPHIGLDRFSADLRAGQCRIATAAQREHSATVDGGFRPESAVTALIALPLVGIGKDAQTAAPPH